MLDVLRSIIIGYRLRSAMDEIESAAASLLADLWSRRRRYGLEGTALKITRMLTSGSRHWVVTGTQAEIEQSARKLSRTTKACVTISVIVGHYHRRGCDERPAGGYDTEGN